MSVLLKKIFVLSIGSLLLVSPAYSSDGHKKETSSVNEALLKQISKGFSAVAKKATPAVVFIECHGAEKLQKVPQKKGPFENPFDHFNDDFFNRFFGYSYQQQQPPSKKKEEMVRGSGFMEIGRAHV